jgi:hypothetical protein
MEINAKAADLELQSDELAEVARIVSDGGAGARATPDYLNRVEMSGVKSSSALDKPVFTLWRRGGDDLHFRILGLGVSPLPDIPTRCDPFLSLASIDAPKPFHGGHTNSSLRLIPRIGIAAVNTVAEDRHVGETGLGDHHTRPLPNCSPPAFLGTPTVRVKMSFQAGTGCE